MRRAVLAAAMAVAAVISVAAASGSATTDDLNPSVARFARIDPSLLQAGGAPLTFTPASVSDTQVSVMLELSGAPVLVRDAEAKKATGKGLTKAEKDSIRAQLK